jgi:hypothetical protein
MNDPPRLLDQTGTDPSALALLRSLDAPAALPPAVQAALAQQLSTMVAASSVKVATGLFWLKTVSVAAIAVGGAGGAYVWNAAMAENPPRTEAGAQASAREPKAPARSSATAEEPALPVVTPEAPALEESKKTGAAPARDVLAEEEALLEAARRAAAHDPARALALLQRHKTQFPRGQLGAERMFLSVDSYRRLGNHAAAKREAEALAKHYPNSTYARRASSLLGSSPP